ncbi:beta-N-acetylhexosaminidase [Microbacterium sp. LWH11-1.2]|uniref:beta-N-acetylhexosaminidase n=1 Tax=Microbacterium sp. LWH11-1.2 TaxID=3135258 RepID=UPI0031398EE2
MTIAPVPAPRSAVERSEAFVLDGRTSVRASAELRRVAELLREQLTPSTGLALPLAAPDDEGDNQIVLAIDGSLDPEAYRLRVAPDGIVIAGGDAAGVHHATQTLRQLLPPEGLRSAAIRRDGWIVPGVDIVDGPAHRWRGLMLDTVRHFIPVREVLRIIDLLSLHHMNVLHLHLTDDQGWRLQILRHPRLTEVGSWRLSTQVGRGEEDGRPHGGYYTQDDIREIVAYAADRHITVVPEIESPGHARAALAAYPELAVGGVAPDGVWTQWGISEDVFSVEESTIAFLCDVLDEVIELFPSAYIGIGGDECPKTRWRDDARTQERMRELGLDDEDQLQAWFVGRLEQHVRARGRRIFGWDEILEGGAAADFGAGTAVASWRGDVGARVAARRGFDVVACPADRVYLDYRQSERADEPVPVGIPLTWRDVYAFEPVPSGLTADEARHVLGGQGNLWLEHIDTPQRVDYMLFPRLGALAEALWTGAGRDADDFSRRMPEYLRRLEALGVDYRPEAGPHPWQTWPGVPGSVRTRAELDEHLARITAGIVESGVGQG